MEKTLKTSTSSQAVSRAKTSHTQNNMEKEDKALLVKEADCGVTCGIYVAKYDLNTSSWKMSQESLPLIMDQISEGFYQIFPKSGIMHNGDVYTHHQSVRPTTERGCSWLLTPTASDYKRYSIGSPSFMKRKGKRSCGTLPEQMSWSGIIGHLNPSLYEWLMGFPIGWTDLKDSETP